MISLLAIESPTGSGNTPARTSVEARARSGASWGTTVGSQALHSIQNNGAMPLHYYPSLAAATQMSR